MKLKWPKLPKIPIDKSDIPALLVILGVVFAGYGAEFLRPGLGFFVAGVLILLYVRPLLRWIR